MKKILISTSGSGGHTVPIKWVTRALRQLDDSLDISFVGAKGDRTAKVLETEFDHDKLHFINTGKYRRYASQTRIQKILDWQTNSRNIADLFKFVVGLRSAYVMLRKIKPDVVLIKGGAVALPVGLAANYLKIPLVTHDSDTIPGISNRIAGKKAVLNLVGSEQGNYPYEPDNIRVVGVPISSKIKPVTNKEQAKLKKALGFDGSKPLLLVSGGSLGAESINDAIEEVGPRLVEQGLQILHQCGERHYKEHQDNKLWDIRPFIDPEVMAQAFGAMDIMLSRASATFTHEVSAARKPLITVPASQLFDQVNNSKHLSDSGAVLMLTDDQLKEDASALYDAIYRLMTDTDTAEHLASKLHQLHNGDSAELIAKSILEVAYAKP